MVIGDCLHFAVEFELDHEFGGMWLFGKFCYWVKGKQIGNYNLGTSLRDLLFQMETIIRDKGKRTNSELFILDSVELFNRLNDALYSCNSCIYYNKAIEETWAKFNVTIPVDIFDEWKLFLIEGNEKARIIIKMPNSNKIIEEELKLEEFDTVFIEAYKELNKLYETEFRKCENS